MKTYKNTAIIFGIVTGALLVTLAIITWKWMQLRKNVAKVATNTPTPTSSAVIASVNTLNTQANSVG